VGWPRLAFAIQLALILLEAGAANPFKAFQIVNFGALWLLGVMMLHFFGSGRPAFAALA
jgi:hypothetical protein